MATMGTSLCDLLWAIGGRHPQSLDANLTAIICSTEHVGKSAGGKEVLVYVE